MKKEIIQFSMYKVCICFVRFIPISFLKIYLLIVLLQLSHFPPFTPLHPVHPLPPIFPTPPQFMSMGHTYKFFGFYISYTILNTLLSILYLPIMLLSPCTIFPIHPFPLPGDNPPNDLHIYESVLVLIVCLISFFSFSC